MRADAESMEQITVRVPANTLEALESEAEDANRTRSKHIRDVLESRHDHAEHECVPLEEFHELETAHERLQDEIDRVREEKRTILEQREENQQLRKYVEDERSAAERHRRASLPQRVKWWIVGYDE